MNNGAQLLVANVGVVTFTSPQEHVGMFGSDKLGMYEGVGRNLWRISVTIHEIGSQAERGMKDAKIRWDVAKICSRANNRKREAKNQEKMRDD